MSSCTLPLTVLAFFAAFSNIAFAQGLERPISRECPPTPSACQCFDGKLRCVDTKTIQKEGNLIVFPFQENIDPNALYEFGKIAGPGAKIQIDVNSKSGIDSKIMLSKEAAESFKERLNIQEQLPQ